MAKIFPFRGLRPQPRLASRVASPPYDVLSTEEARELAREEPISFLRVNKAELELEGVDPHAPEVYRRAAANLDRLVSEGVMVRDRERSFYVYRLTMLGRSQTGLVARTSVEEYAAGRIKRHELTRPAKVADRADHIVALGAQVGPVLSTFRARASITDALRLVTVAPPEVDFVAADGVRHELWVIDERGTIDALISAFGELDSLYIADGHHRSEAALEVDRRRRAGTTGTRVVHAETFLSVLFAAEELSILPYNRVVRDTSGLSVDGLLERIEPAFTHGRVDEAVEPDRAHRFGLYCDHEWFVLDAREGSFDRDHPTRSIDAAILGDLLLAPVLGITDPRQDPRIDFVGGIRGTRELERLVDSGAFALAFSLHPTSIDELLRVADAGEVMPPKSTWFEPKLRSGLVVSLLDE